AGVLSPRPAYPHSERPGSRSRDRTRSDHTSDAQCTNRQFGYYTDETVNDGPSRIAMWVGRLPINNGRVFAGGRPALLEPAIHSLPPSGRTGMRSHAGSGEKRVGWKLDTYLTGRDGLVTERALSEGSWAEGRSRTDGAAGAAAAAAAAAPTARTP